MSKYGSNVYGLKYYGGGPSLTTLISQSTIYGSNRYENLILGHLPTAVFGSYVTTSNSIDDETNHDFLSATLAVGASVTNQIPFFSLPNLDYTFNIATANAITIKENTLVVSRSVGAGRFSKGDETSQFTFEFLFSHNYGTTTDIVTFGNSSASPQMKIYYASNAFVLDIYGDVNSNLALTSGTKLRYRSVVEDNDTSESKHVALVFDQGNPNFYVNGIVARKIVDELRGDAFFDERISSRTIAKFDGGASATGLVSMISMYNYALTKPMIDSHYAAALNLEETNKYAGRFGSLLLDEPNGIKQTMERNTNNSQNFENTNIYNTYIVNGSICVNNQYNYESYSTLQDAKKIPSNNYSIRWNNFGSSFDYINDSIILKFEGKSTSGSYTADNCLFSIQKISLNDYQDDIYVGINASSKLYIATTASGVLSTSTASIAKTARTISINLSSSNVSIYDLTSGASTTASTGTQNLSQSVAYYYNGYYSSSVTGLLIERGSPEVNVTTASFGTKYQTGKHTSYLSMEGDTEYYIDVTSSGRALVYMPIPQDNTLFFSASGTPNITYTLITDGTSQTITPDSEITSSSTASSVAIQVDLVSYNNSSLAKLEWLKIINTESFTQSNGTYNSRLINSNGIHSNPKENFVLSKQKVIDFLNKSNSLTYFTRSSETYTGSVTSSATTTTITGISSTDNFKVGQYVLVSSGAGSIGTGASITTINSSSHITITSISANSAGSVTFYVDPIGQADFLISIPTTLVASTQYLFQYVTNSASMYLTYNSPSNLYILNFAGMTASVNNSLAISGTTQIKPTNTYYIQLSLGAPIIDTASAYVFSSSVSTNRFLHSFDQLSVYPFGLTNQSKRYAQIFGRPTYSISDSTSPYINISAIPENVIAYNKNWQSYGN